MQGFLFFVGRCIGAAVFLVYLIAAGDEPSALRLRAVQFVKNSAVLFTFGKNYGIIQSIDKLEFDGGSANG